MLTQVAAGEVPSSNRLERAAYHLERVRRWETSTKLSGEIGFLRLLQAFRMDDADVNRAAVAAAATENLTESLRLSSARPHPWVRLAYARAIEAAEPSEIVGLLDRSIAVGPYVGEIAIVRLKKLLANWAHLSPDLRRYTFQQVRWVWNSEKSYLLRAARQSTRPEIMRFALRPIPGAVEQFDRVVPSH